ncbi:MAG: Na/Pi symporter [Candidatus Aureabacteria bacterium]|nr:Na/Pi symporter [Candidatus Auribacterota bacterium]
MDNIHLKESETGKGFRDILKIAVVLMLIYLFLVSIKMMGLSFKLFGRGFAESLINSTTNRFVGLFIGILATSIIQSSSTVTSIVVGMVGGGMLTITNAIPIIMGANIGTSVTNTLVSMGHINRKDEFKRAFHGAILHDHFNFLSVMVLFPLELAFGPLQWIAAKSSKYVMRIDWISHEGAFAYCIGLPSKMLKGFLISDVGLSKTTAGALILSLSLIILIFGLTMIVRVMKSMMLERIESFFDKYIFKYAVLSLFLGLLLTALVQSSSVTTSLVVPLMGAGILNPNQVFPYMIGANIGTTVTAMLAAVATCSQAAIIVALVHFFFNLFGAVIWYPFKKVPLKLSNWICNFVLVKRRYAIGYIVFMFFILPALLIFFSRFF